MMINDEISNDSQSIENDSILAGVYSLHWENRFQKRNSPLQFDRLPGDVGGVKRCTILNFSRLVRSAVQSACKPGFAIPFPICGGSLEISSMCTSNSSSHEETRWIDEILFEKENPRNDWSFFGGNKHLLCCCRVIWISKENIQGKRGSFKAFVTSDC